jgi:hypothetical protein
MQLRLIDWLFILGVLIGGVLSRTYVDSFGKFYPSILFWAWFVVYLIPWVSIRFKTMIRTISELRKR